MRVKRTRFGVRRPAVALLQRASYQCPQAKCSFNKATQAVALQVVLGLVIGYHTQTLTTPYRPPYRSRKRGIRLLAQTAKKQQHEPTSHAPWELVSNRQQRLVIHNLVKRDPLAGLAEDVRKGLNASPKRFLPKFIVEVLG